MLLCEEKTYVKKDLTRPRNFANNIYKKKSKEITSLVLVINYKDIRLNMSNFNTTMLNDLLFVLYIFFQNPCSVFTQ